MNRRLYAIVVVLLVGLTLVGCRGKKSQDPPSASRSAADLHAISQRELKVDGDQIPHPAALSPDGKWLAAFDGQGRLCIYAIETLAEQHCLHLEGQQIDPLSVAWSPDSRWLTFTDDPNADFQSDLWVSQIETGALRNLTHDQSLIRHPIWSPDGKTLAFFRALQGELALYRIPVEGGALERLQADKQFTGNYLWAGDGKKILFAVFGATPEEGGLWIVNRDGQDLHQLVGIDPQLGPPSVMDVSAKGNKALIIYRMAGSRDFFSQPNLSYCALLDLETGEVEPLKQAQGEAVEFYGPTDATFSPDGSKVLYSYKDAAKQPVLAVRDVKGDGEKILFVSQVSELFYGHGLSLTWARNDTVYLPHAGLLLTLGGE